MAITPKGSKSDASAPEDRDVEESRTQCMNVMEEHLCGFLDNNPNGNYVSWIATLHPENAEVTIDPRFLIPENPWWTVWEETKNTVTVLGVPVEDETSNSPGNENADGGSTATSDQSNTGGAPAYFGGLFSLILGMTIIITAVVTAFSIELVSLILYLLAIASAGMKKAFSRRKLNCATTCPFFLAAFLTLLFQSIDFLLLLISTLIAELLAGVCFLVCAILSLSISVASRYHQSCRKLAHYTRWAFRLQFDGYEPPRTLTLDWEDYNCCRHGFSTGDDNSVSTAGSEVVIAEVAVPAQGNPSKDGSQKLWA